MKRAIASLAAVILGIGVYSAPALASPWSAETSCEASTDLCDALSSDAGAAPLGADEYGDVANPALMPMPFEIPAPETALFTVEEATAPFLGPTNGAGTRVEIAIETEGYQDLFTIYFPRGSAYLTLPAGDMVALAAEAVRDMDDVEVWISGGAALSPDLAAHRMGVVQDMLLQNDIPGRWIHLDDGSVNAILNRPESLSNDIEL